MLTNKVGGRNLNIDLRGYISVHFFFRNERVLITISWQHAVVFGLVALTALFKR